MITFANKLLKVDNKALKASGIVPPAPTVLDEMQFIYLANNFDGTSIPNSTTNSDTDIGTFNVNGVIIKNGSGSSCYLTNGGRYQNYLYTNVSNDQLEKMKGVDNVYTFFMRVMQDTSTGTGGIVSWRTGTTGGYVYMIRCVNKYLQIHTTSGNTLGSGFQLTSDIVFKVEVNGATFTAKNLSTNATSTITYSDNRNMGTTMTSFYAGSGGEGELNKFFGIAGIDRATTAEEDALIASHLMSQGVS